MNAARIDPPAAQVAAWDALWRVLLTPPEEHEAAGVLATPAAELEVKRNAPALQPTHPE